MYKIIHCVALHTLCDITQMVSNYYTVKCQIFQSGKNYTGQKKFTQAPPVVPVTNIRYGPAMHFVLERPAPIRN